MHKLMAAVLLVGASALMMSGCGGGGNTDNTTGDTAKYVPLVVGNTWQYDYNEYTLPSAVRSAKSLLRPRGGLGIAHGLKGKDLSAVDIVEVTGTQDIAGGTWYSLVAHYVGGDPDPAVYARHNSSGFLRKDSLSAVPYYMIHSPLTVGTSWIVNYTSGGSAYHETYTIVAVNQTVGSYTKCIEIENVYTEVGQPDDVITYWYAPDVGEVREERHLGANLAYDLTLTQFTPATP